ncbi:MAG: hypothetical protein HC909_04245 [Blastochloris sp.]|nr:hypothetical protein [Blastochloris sp.]
MKALELIKALYEAIDQGFNGERLEALHLGNEAAARHIEQKQLLNDQAYFVLCWGQLEAEIDDACRTAIRRRQSNASWDMRRGFDIYDPNDKRLSGLPFDRRVAIVLDRGGDPGRPYAKVMSYYEMRNKIAHGRLEATRIDLTEVIADFYIIQGALTR